MAAIRAVELGVEKAQLIMRKIVEGLTPHSSANLLTVREPTARLVNSESNSLSLGWFSLCHFLRIGVENQSRGGIYG